MRRGRCHPLSGERLDAPFGQPGKQDPGMSLIARSVLRIGTLLAALAGCAWGAAQYSDWRSFERRNPDAIAFCGSLTPGMPIADAQGRARAISGAMVAMVNHRLVVRFPGQNLCVVEITGGRVHSAAVGRNG